MQNLPLYLNSQSTLRLDAETRLREGATPPTNGWTLGVDILELLYTLASNPDRAAEALKLLHELQVHQVELDLQLNQLQSTDRENSEELAYYHSLYHHAPVGYLVLDYDGRIIETNVLGSKLLAVDRDALGVRCIEALLAPECRLSVNSLVKDLRDGGSGGSCTVQSDIDNRMQRLQLTLSRAVRGEAILAVVAALD